MSRLLYCVVLLFVAGTMLAQRPAKKPADKKAETVQEQVAPDDMVILITGACQTQPGEFAVRDCIRGVTRQEFEALIAATNPNSTPQLRQKIAGELGQIIILSNEAKKRELPKDPEVKELLRVQQLQLLANLLIARSMKKEAANISDTDIESFYREHLSDYQTAELLHVIIPRKNTEGEPSEDDKAFAETIRSRCAAGEDPAKLQAEAFQRAGRGTAAPVDLKNQRRSMFPAAQQSMFDLKPGECSSIATDRTEFSVYKVIAATTTPLAEARNAIVNSIEAARMKSQLDALKNQNAISLNGKYFGSAPSPTPSEAKPGDSSPGSTPK